MSKALEFAEYMAKSAEGFLDTANTLAWNLMNTVDNQDEQERFTEYGRALRNDIYEFRKRVVIANAECDALRKDAERYRLARNHVSLILTEDSMFLAGLRIEIFYDEPQTLYLAGPKSSFGHNDQLFDAAIDEALEQ